MSKKNPQEFTGIIGHIGDPINYEGWKDKILRQDLLQNFTKITPDMIPENFEGEPINYEGWKDKILHREHQKSQKKSWKETLSKFFKEKHN